MTEATGFSERRTAGEMICEKCGGFSSTRTCWTCHKIPEALFSVHNPMTEQLRNLLKRAVPMKMISGTGETETKYVITLNETEYGELILLPGI